MEPGLIVVSIGRHTRLGDILETALDGAPFLSVTADQFAGANLSNRRVLFAISLDPYGLADGIAALLSRLRRDPIAMEGSVGALLIDGEIELYTKAFARTLAFDANRAGCALLPRALVEATKWLRNFDVLSDVHGVDRYTAYQNAACVLVRRLTEYEPVRADRPNILLLHASNRASSNTLALGLETSARLARYCDVTEIALHSGAIYDCNGCGYKACSHFAEQQTCFYGGVVPETVFPAIERCDAMLLCCPNYNDAPGAYFLALNNRLNALMLRSASARTRALFAIVVSGYSGGDLVAKQLLGGYCLNKPFLLPPRFALLETANSPGAVMEDSGVFDRLDAFAAGILGALCKNI